MPPSPWRFKQEPCPKVLAVTLHLPWSWAFFNGGPAAWKDVENRKKAFPILPPGTILVLHNGMSYRPAAEAFVKRQLPECAPPSTPPESPALCAPLGALANRTPSAPSMQGNSLVAHTPGTLPSLPP